MLVRLIFDVFVFRKIPIKACSRARSRKITNLQFFNSRLVAAISPRVFRCFEKVIFLDFEVRKCENTWVFTLSPLKNTRNLYFLRFFIN